MLRRMECRLNFKNRPEEPEISRGVLNNPPATNRGSQEPATNRVKLFSVESRKTSPGESIRPPPPPPVIGFSKKV